MEDSELYWLWLASAEGVGATTANSLWAKLLDRGMPLEDFFELDENAWAEEFGLNARVVRGLADQRARLDDLRVRAEELRERGVRLVTLAGPHYPASLRKALRRNAPPLLYALGNLALLMRSAVAVIGARDASPRGLALARSIGATAVASGLVLVSGGARGIDSAAHVGALAAGGETVVVLSCGILRYRPSADLGAEADPESVLYVSELAPTMSWEVGGAMARNRIVCGLASAVVVVEARETGGTMQAARTAVDMPRPLFVAKFRDFDIHSAGNATLLATGAHALKVEPDASGETWTADLDPVVARIARATPPEAAAGQMDLFGSQ